MQFFSGVEAVKLYARILTFKHHVLTFAEVQAMTPSDIVFCAAEFLIYLDEKKS